MKFVVSAAVALLLACRGTPAPAQGADADMLVRLFTEICVSNMGDLKAVRAWAEHHDLSRIASPAGRRILLGPGMDGEAWAVPSAAPDRIALSIQNPTHACIVWAQRADPRTVRAAFDRAVNESAHRGVAITRLDQKVDNTPDALAYRIAYQVRKLGSQKAFVLTLRATEVQDAPVQAALEAAPFR